MEWEKVLADAASTGSISELHLRKLPLLKNTTNWKKVELVGLVDYQMKFTHYKGGLVKLNGSLYFIQQQTINALKDMLDWHFPRKIQVFP